MGPGPCTPYPEAMEALGRPIMGHLDPEFLSIFDETRDRLRTVFGTANRVTIPVPGTGSAGMEAAFVNILNPGDTVVIAVNGMFGERMCDLAHRCDANVIPVNFEWGTPIDPAVVSIAAYEAGAKMIAAVHAETSTGVLNDIAALGAAKGDSLLLADCVTSIGGMVLDLDAWGVDIAYGGTQKCLGVPPGLAPLTMTEAAWEQRVVKPRSWYFDLGVIGGHTPHAALAYHHTAPIAMIASLHAGLGAVLDEGLDNCVARHATCGRALQDGLIGLGLELWVKEEDRLAQLTTVRVPDGVDSGALRRELLSRYGIEIGAGVKEWSSKIWRIGCMGHAARLRNVALLLSALDELL